MVKCRMAMIPPKLKEEREKLIDKMPHIDMTTKEFIRRLDALIAVEGSEELRAWCKEQDEIYEDKRRRGVELS